VKVFLALHDAGIQSDSNTYWTWNSSSLSTRLLQHLFYESVQPVRSECSAIAGPGTIHAGIAKHSGEDPYTAIFRFIKGGRDQHGRTDRAILAVGVVLEPNVSVRELYRVVQGEVFQSIVSNSKHLPVPPPESLELEIGDLSDSNSKCLEIEIHREAITNFKFSDNFEHMSTICENLPHANWLCGLEIVGESGKGWLRAGDVPSTNPKIQNSSSRYGQKAPARKRRHFLSAVLNRLPQGFMVELDRIKASGRFSVYCLLLGVIIGLLMRDLMVFVF
jgi:hypothetical protein